MARILSHPNPQVGKHWAVVELLNTIEECGHVLPANLVKAVTDADTDTALKILKEQEEQEPDGIDIFSPHGTKVRWKYPQNGHEADRIIGAKYLKFNELYTVDYTIVYDTSTDVYLVEVPGVAFNSVQFAKP